MSKPMDPNSIVFATGGYDHSIKFWYPHDGVCYRTVQHPESQVNHLEVTPDKRYVASAAYQQIRMYDVNSSEPTPVYIFEGISKNVNCIGFYDNGQFMYSGGEDCMARIWDLRGRGQQCQRLFQVNDPINCMCLHPNQSTLLLGDQSGTIHVWDLTSDYNEQLIPEPDVAIHSLNIDPDGAYLAAVNSKGTCYVWSLSISSGLGTSRITLTPRVKKHAHQRYALKCVFSPDSSLLATTSADGLCKIWSTADFSLRNTLKKSPEKWVWDCAFSSDSQYIFTACSDHAARLWHVDRPDPVREYQGHTKAITAIAYNDQRL